MKRLAIITVGKTHSGKTAFARMLEDVLPNSFVMDQDNQALFLNTYYKNLLPTEGPNTLKHALSQVIVKHAMEQTDLHFIICNANRSRDSRAYLLDELFPSDRFVRILVHFDLADEVLHERVTTSARSTAIFRDATLTFEELLSHQHREDVIDPIEGEADYLFVLKDSSEVESVMQEIIHLAKNQKPLNI
ncbi:AAA family ATPase [Priestia taiwanensis]|uniref:CRISPR-associated endoribonuclease Cas2 n=1 Tax=Priestia taiwanensis TaxID=1347902 RepID=A0A917AUJ2_9BACI|nr:AAA family ATPase [Priestia taiwanensis]MBM7364003.1 putative kinase [Priestia taiwanensis]GGE70875.1 CRISPR-associated endoribonuclease Cas2 [Priestia taiwanensis]